MDNATKNEILDRTWTCISNDGDIRRFGSNIIDRYGMLLDHCAAEPGNTYEDHYSKELVSNWICFNDFCGGSLADYCASACLDGLNGYVLMLYEGEDGNEIREELYQRIMQPRPDQSHAIYPEKIIDALRREAILY